MLPIYNKMRRRILYETLSNDLKVLKFCCDSNDCRRLFQILADALEETRSPSVFSIVVNGPDARAEVVCQSLLDSDHAF